MYFKNPEILYFLLLLIVPILVHLFQLRRFKIEYFTNVRFLKELSIQTRKSSNIKKWLLLTTRLLLLAFIILAFAQPSFTAIEKSMSTNELYIILDNSFSMQAKGKKGELLKRAVQDLLEETPENLNFSLLTNSENFWNTDIKAIRNSLQNINYSAIPFQLDNIMAQLNARKSSRKKDIVVITDATGINQRELKINEEINSLKFVVPKAEQKNNVSIDSVFIKSASDEFYEISINLRAYGEGTQPVPVALYNQSKLIAKTTVPFDASKKTIFFTIPKQHFHGYVSIVDDGLTYDNNYYFSISDTKKINVISVGATEKSNFLSRIYTTNEFVFSNSTLQSLDYNKLQDQDVIVLNELEEIPQALQTTLKSFVEKGGNLIVIPSPISSTVNLNSLLMNFGNMKFNALQSEEKLVNKINFGHPLFSSVFEKKVNNFQFPKAKNSFTVSSSGPAALLFADQSPFLSSIKNAIAFVYVFTAPINTTNSNFQQSPLIVPTFYKMATSNQNNSINAAVIGQNKAHLTAAQLNKDDILMVKNSEEQFIPIQQILNNKVRMTFNDYPEKSGNYGIYNKKDLVENISFNYSRSESDLAGTNENLLADYKVIDSTATFFNTLESNKADNQIWKWFVIFALLFLLTEMAIIRFVK